LSCEKNNPEQTPSIPSTLSEGFISFSSTGQTILNTAIDSYHQQVEFEVDHDVDITRLVPEFVVPEGYTVQINGIPQLSGSSTIDFSKPVIYELKDWENRSTKWEAAAVKLSPKILIDASHDGGGWWFPQSPLTGFDPAKPHQGQQFAEHLRKKGFQVDELGRGEELKEKTFFGYYIIIRVSGFQPYTDKELKIYSKLVKRGMNMVFFTDHKKNDPVDELGDQLGLKFEGVAFGVINSLKPHVITENISSIDYIAGSVLTNSEQNPDIEILGRLRENDYADLNFNGVKDANEPSAPPVMGILNYPESHIFFIGDTNGLEIMPQPFIDNLIQWMGDCF
jgi:hypothetical protein